jgi:hypothetical protein
MQAKTIVTGVLLLFVAFSVGVLIGKEMGLRPRVVVSPATSGPVGSKAEATAPKVIAYYFHGTSRCVTCKKIEAYAWDAIKEAYPDFLKRGQLGLRSVDYEEPGNEHFLADYSLSSPSLVLVDPRRTGPDSWKILQETWQLNDDKPAFFAYIKDEVGKFLKSQGG